MQINTNTQKTQISGGGDIYVSLGEFFSNSEHECAPDDVVLTFTAQTLWAMHRAAETLERNPCFESIGINAFDWTVGETYDGKARHGKLALIKFGKGFDLEFSFFNDYTDTRFNSYVGLLETENLLEAAVKFI